MLTFTVQEAATLLPDDLMLMIAQVAHGAVGAIQLADSDPAPAPPWADRSPDQWRRAAEGIRATMTLARPGDTWEQWAEREWQRWSADKRAGGWTWGPDKDPAAKTHPCLTASYTQVPPIQKAKDLVRIAVIESFLAIYQDGMK